MAAGVSLALYAKNGISAVKNDVIKAISLAPYREKQVIERIIFYSEPTSSEEIEIFVYKHGNYRLNLITTLSDAVVRSAKRISGYSKQELISDIQTSSFSEQQPETFINVFKEVVRNRMALNVSDVGEVKRVWVLDDEFLIKTLFSETSQGFIWFKWECSA